MKFDILKWREISLNKDIIVGHTLVHVRASAEVAVFVSAHGVETLAGYGHTVKVVCKQIDSLRVEGPKNARVFYESPADTYVEPSGEVFTNTDRRPLESGAVLEVRRALREFKLEQKQQRDQIRRERAALENARNPEPNPVAQPESSPAPEPEPTPAPEPEPAASE